MDQSELKVKKLKILLVDDHELVLGGTLGALKQEYPEAEILTAQTAQAALTQIESSQPNLVIADLAMPETIGEAPRPDTGIRLLKTMMQKHPTLNIVVQSVHVQTLVRLKPTIGSHEGGFTVASKSLPMREMLTRVDWALQGVVYTPKEMRNGLEVKPEWLQMLHLAFNEGLQDRAIAERMHVAERTVRHYWTKLRDALDVYPDEGKNIRIQTELRAREEGLID